MREVLSRLSRQIARPGTTPYLHPPDEHFPDLRMESFGQSEHCDDEGPVHAAHEESQVLQEEEELSKYVPFSQYSKQRPLASTGRDEGQVRQDEELDPEHVAQSGEQERQVPFEATELEGQSDTHAPLEAKDGVAHLVQVVALP